MKEMVGGCCVCSDERGWPENPLVYCDGSGCTVAVHQACYGIVTVPTGPWFCRKCESQERPTRVRCELCPSKDGALKRTDTQSWAHVVCALYIPEVRFGNVTTMEPIILQLIPQERYSKVCYICQDLGKGSKAQVGACMPCNKSGCKQQFHVTCAQALGLLCEEAGNYLDNVKYCGYCQHHYSKLKKGGNVKTIPPYKPVNVNSSDPPSSPERETETVPSTSTSNLTSSSTTSLGSNPQTPKIIIQTSTASIMQTNQVQTAQNSSSSSSSTSSNSKQRKTGGSSSSQSSSSTPSSKQQQSLNQSSASQSTTSTSSSSNTLTTNTAISNNNSSSNNNLPSIESSGSSSSNSTKEKEKSNRSVSKTVSSSSKSSGKEAREKYQSSKSGKSHSGKESTSSVEYDAGNHSQNDSTPISSIISNVNTMSKDGLGQKFTTSNFTETVVMNSDSVFGNDSKSTNQSGTNAAPLVKKRKLDAGKSNSLDELGRDIIKDVSVTLVPLPFDRVDSTEIIKKQKLMDSSSKAPLHTTSNNTPNVIAHPSEAMNTAPYTNVLTSTTTSAPVSLVVSVPLSTATLSGVSLPVNTSSILNSSNHQVQSIKSFAPAKIEAMPSAIVNRTNIVVNTIGNQAIDSAHYGKDPPSVGLSEQQTVVVKNPKSSPTLNKLSSIKENSKSSGKHSPMTTAQQMVQHCLESPLAGNAGPVNANVTISTSTITTMESGGIKVTYDKQQTNSKTSQSNDDNNMGLDPSPPDDNSSMSGLKFSFEPQSNSYTTPSMTPQPDIKESPPSSPGSEAGSKKRSSAIHDTKDYRMHSKSVTATHMLGNQLNPASSVAQKMTDQLYMEIEEHSAYTSSSLDSGTQLIGPTFPGKHLNNARNNAANQPVGPSLSSLLGGTGIPSATGNTPQSLEQLLERQWEQGSQFLMEQAQHFDIASLLSCLHQLKSENIRLEEHVANLVARRDHLLAVNARLAIPLNPISVQNANSTQASFNNMHTNGSAEIAANAARRTIENQNGVDFRHTAQPPQMNARFDVINKRSKSDNR